MYLEGGLDGFSMRRLARSLDVTAPALYRHYEGKEALLRDVIDEAFKMFGAFLYRALAGLTAQERLRMTGEGYLAFALEHPRLYQVIHVSPELLGFDDLPADVTRQACATGQFLVDRVRECMDADVLAGDDPQAVATTIWAFSHGLVSLYLDGVLTLDRDAFLAVFHSSFARLFAGIAGPAFKPPAAAAADPISFAPGQLR